MMDQSNLIVLMEKNYNLAIMNTITMLLINSFFIIIETFVPPPLSNYVRQKTKSNMCVRPMMASTMFI
jgi:hypothetical protein